MQLNKLKYFNNDNIGPGTYAIANEKFLQNKSKQSFSQAQTHSQSFGTSSARPLDNREPGKIMNPGPGAY